MLQKNLIRTSFMAVAIASLIACGSAPEKKDAVADCTFPDAPTAAAPEWICSEIIDGVEVAAVGSFHATKAGHQFQKTQAAAAARNALASRMKVHVKALVKSYVEITGSTVEDETVDAVNSNVSKQITNESLYGTRVVKTRTSPTGVLYVLVGMNTADAAKASQDALRSSYKNKKALWQKIMAKEAHADLDAEIEKIANQDVN